MIGFMAGCLGYRLDASGCHMPNVAYCTRRFSIGDRIPASQIPISRRKGPPVLVLKRFRDFAAEAALAAQPTLAPLFSHFALGVQPMLGCIERDIDRITGE